MKYWKIFGLFIITNYGISTYSQCYELFDFRQCKSGIESILISPDEKYCITGHLDGSLCVWDTRTFSLLNTINYHTGQVNTILFNKEKDLIITSANDNKAVTWAIPSLYMLQIYDTPIEQLTFAVIDAGSNYVYYGGYNSILSNDYNYDFDRIPIGAVFRIGYKSKVNEFFYNDQTNSSSITDGNISYEDNKMYFTRYKNIYRYDMDEGLVDYIPLPHILNNFAIGNGVLYIWGGGQLMKLKDFDPKKGYKEAPATLNFDATTSYSKIAISKSGKLLATGDSFNEVIIWNEKDLTIKQVLFGHTQRSRVFEFYNNDGNLLTGGYDGRLMIWKAKADTNCTDEYKDGIAHTSKGAPVKIFSKKINMKDCNVYSPDIKIQFKSEPKQDTISLYLNDQQIYYNTARDWVSLSVKIDFTKYYNTITYYTKSKGEEVKKLHVKIDDGVFPVAMTLTTEIDETDAIRFIKN